MVHVRFWPQSYGFLRYICFVLVHHQHFRSCAWNRPRLFYHFDFLGSLGLCQLLTRANYRSIHQPSVWLQREVVSRINSFWNRVLANHEVKSGNISHDFMFCWLYLLCCLGMGAHFYASVAWWELKVISSDRINLLLHLPKLGVDCRPLNFLKFQVIAGLSLVHVINESYVVLPVDRNQIQVLVQASFVDCVYVLVIFWQYTLAQPASNWHQLGMRIY